jgi:hypothetical protein
MACSATRRILFGYILTSEIEDPSLHPPFVLGARPPTSDNFDAPPQISPPRRRGQQIPPPLEGKRTSKGERRKITASWLSVERLVSGVHHPSPAPQPHPGSARHCSSLDNSSRLAPSRQPRFCCIRAQPRRTGSRLNGSHKRLRGSALSTVD